MHSVTFSCALQSLTFVNDHGIGQPLSSYYGMQKIVFCEVSVVIVRF
jgi:hypothetical protein